VIVRYRALFELGLACAALVGVGVSWVHARYVVPVAPITDGQPSTTALVYNPQLLLLAMLLAMIAGVLAVVGASRLRRAR
jgi:cell division protein FtsX